MNTSTETDNIVTLDSSLQHCYHCGEECGNDTVLHQEKSFCCQGCKTVYELLADGGLCDYYSFEERLQQPLSFTTDTISAFSYLDTPEIQAMLLDFNSPTLSIVTLYLPQIHCASCLWLLEHLHQLSPGILHSEVNFLQKQITIRFNSQKISLRTIAELLTRIGYKPEISLDVVGKQEKRSSQLRPLLTKIAVAGFAFGNIMLLSVPDYLSGGNLEDLFAIPFIIINIILATPVVFYAAWDYYKASYISLQQKEIAVDVPVAIGILVIYFRSLYDVFAGIGPGYFDSLVGLIFFLLLGKLLQRRTFDALAFERDYKSYFPLAATVFQNGKEISKAVTELQKGEIILVRSGEIVPADSLLLSDSALLDYSFVTGESVPANAKAADSIYAGARVVGSSIRLQVQKEVSRSYLTQLWNNAAFSKEKRSSLAEFSLVFGKYFTMITFAFAFLGAFLHIEDGGMAAQVFTAVLIIACPCAYTLAAPFAFGTLQQFFGKSGLYLKNPDVVAELAAVDSIIFDKTGTLTSAEADVAFFGEHELTQAEQAILLSVFVHSAHPLSRSVYVWLKNTLPASVTPVIVREFTEYTGKGISAKVGETNILAGSLSFLREHNISVPEAFCSPDSSASVVYICINTKFTGIFTISTALRKNLSSVFQELSSKYPISLLSGDSTKEEARFSSILPAGSVLRFQQSPQDKMNVVTEQQKSGKKVLMVGDGLNDAGALRASAVGIAVSENVALFSPASDAILDGNNLSMLPTYIKAAKNTVTVVHTGFALSLVYNSIGLYFALTGELTPLVCAILMPISSLSVIGIAVFGAMLVAKTKKIG